MKILTRKEFLNMPIGTVYSEYEPCFFRGLMVKDSEPGRYENDYLYSDLIAPIQCDNSEEFVENCERMEKGESIPLEFDSTSRDGMFYDKQLYAIYEKKDIEQLIKALNPPLKSTL